MSITISRKGAEYLMAYTLGDHDLRLGLYNGYSGTLDYELTAYASFTQPNLSSGYAPVTVSGAMWGSVISPSGTMVYRQATLPGSLPFKFTFNGANPSGELPIQGYFVYISGWPGAGQMHVLWSEAKAPFQPTDSGGDYINVKPKVEFA